MNKLDMLFNNIPMTWKRTVIFALAAGIVTGLLMLPPFLKDTSFQDIGTYVECWVVFAVIIVANCEKPIEAALKCFVFFLISQPLVYLVQIAVGAMTFDRAWMYYSGMWLFATVLTLPGGFIAHYCRKQTVFGSIVLGIGNLIILLMGGHYLLGFFSPVCPRFFGFIPAHTLSFLFCLAAPILMTLSLQKQKRGRIIALAFAFGFAVLVLVFAKITGRFI